MEFLANVPTWDEIERNLDHKFGELNQSVYQGWHNVQGDWDGFSQRLGTGFNQAYGQLGGNRIAAVREAMHLSYPIVQTDLERRLASIEINQISGVLLQIAKEAALILGGSIAVGSIIGGGTGALAFGAGAVPGAVIGLQVGNVILIGYGLKAIGEYFYQGLPNCLATLQSGIITAWSAEDGRYSGLDPTGGSAARRRSMVEQASLQLAKGQEQLVLLLLTAMVTYLTRGQIKAGLVSSAESIAARSAKLQAEMPNKRLAEWLARNDKKLLAEPQLRQVEAPKSPETMRAFYAKQDTGFVSLEEKIVKVKTFETNGLSTAQIERYLNSTDGKKLLLSLKSADPLSSTASIYRRAVGQLKSGSTLPVIKLMDTPLIKIVPEGQAVSPYSPFFTTSEELKHAARSGKTLADSLGLPLSSESLSYSIYEIKPLGTVEVFTSKVAPTSELGGTINRAGGALQYLAPNRSQWTAPELIGTTTN